MHMCGTGLEKEVEICATNKPNKIKYLSSVNVTEVVQ
jgi:hypothetical protein